MYEEVFAGLDQDPAEHFATTFDEHHEEMVLVRDIEVYSLCEHHMLPFLRQGARGLHPGPTATSTGLSKVARVVECFATPPASTGTADGRRSRDSLHRGSCTRWEWPS